MLFGFAIHITSKHTKRGENCADRKMETDMDKTCHSCANSYDGADSVLRCRVSSNGLECSDAAAEYCKQFQREPGSDAEERKCVGCNGCK
jgi:hypothetical protein